MRASVLVPALNASDTIVECLAALRKQSEPCENYEIIVVDDGSVDGTAERAQRAGVSVIRCQHHGAAAARNRAARDARGEILLFTDADCVPSMNWIQEMLSSFAERDVVGVKGAYRTRQTAAVARFVQCEYEQKCDRLRGARSIDFIDTYSAGYRREVFLANGGFDESFPTASVEDQELSFRLSKRGARLVYNPNALVFHRHPATIRAYARRKFWIGYWKARVHRLHPDKAWGDSHTPPTLRIQVALVPLLIVSLGMTPFAPMLWAAVALLAGGFALSAVPLLVHISRRDPGIVLLAPSMILVRAMALAAGLAAGVIGQVSHSVWRTRALVKTTPASVRGSGRS